jgi:hypothetical protein
MIRNISGQLRDDEKHKILDDIGHQCQCNVGHSGHRCTTIVNKNHYFLTNTPKGETISYETIKVLCKPCIDKNHHLRLPFPPIPKLPFNFPH